MGSNHEKNGDQKSRDTLPLTTSYHVDAGSEKCKTSLMSFV